MGKTGWFFWYLKPFSFSARIELSIFTKYMTIFKKYAETFLWDRVYFHGIYSGTGSGIGGLNDTSQLTLNHT